MSRGVSPSVCTFASLATPTTTQRDRPRGALPGPPTASRSARKRRAIGSLRTHGRSIRPVGVANLTKVATAEDLDVRRLDERVDLRPDRDEAPAVAGRLEASDVKSPELVLSGCGCKLLMPPTVRRTSAWLSPPTAKRSLGLSAATRSGWPMESDPLRRRPRCRRLATRWVKVRFLGQVNMNEREQFIIDACGARAAVSADGDARVRGQRSATSVAIGLALLPLQGEPDWVRDEDNVPLLGDGREEGVRG